MLGAVWGLVQTYCRRFKDSLGSYPGTSALFSSHQLGASGEDLAASYLRRHGFRVIERNHRNAGGEIDLVAIDRRTRALVLVEVKTRRYLASGESAADTVDTNKRRRLTNAALAYVRRNRLEGCRVRFDVVTIVWPADTGQPTILHQRGAFEATHTEVGP